MAEKTGDLSLEDFSKRIRETLVASINAARNAEITEEEIDAIIKNAHEEYGKMALSRVINRIKKLIKNKIEIKAATAVKGCFVGSRDKFDRNAPIRYLLLKPDKQHLEISNFGDKTTYRENEEYPIPLPSLMTVRVSPDIKYSTWNLVAIEDITRETVERDQLISVLNNVAIEAKDITKEYAWSKDSPAKPVVLYGTIIRVSPEVVFKERETPDEKAEVDKLLPVWAETGDGFKPCFNFGLRTKSGKFIRCHIEQQRYGKPTLMVEQLDDLCKQAVEKYPHDQKAQGAYLSEWLEDLPVLVAGVVSSYKESMDKSGKGVTNVEIGVVSIVETNDRVEGAATQTMIPKDEKVEKATEPKKEKVPTPKPEPKPEPEQPKEEKKEEKPLAPFGLQLTDTISSDIKLWCTAANVDPGSLTIDVIREKALDRYKDIPDAIIVAAIEKIQSGDA